MDVHVAIFFCLGGWSILVGNNIWQPLWMVKTGGFKTLLWEDAQWIVSLVSDIQISSISRKSNDLYVYVIVD